MNEYNEYVLVIRFEGVDVDAMIENHARRINEEYMNRWGGDPAQVFTIAILRLGGPEHVSIRYRGPADSTQWLEDEIQEAAQQEGGQAHMTTSVVYGDITDEY